VIDNRIDTTSVSTFDKERDIIYHTMDFNRVNLPQDIDSVTIAHDVFYDRETDLYNDEKRFWEGITPLPTKEGEMARRWDEKRLTDKEILQLNRFIQSAGSYRYTQSALGHADIFLYYYKNNKIVYKIMISSITRNIIFLQDQWTIRNCINMKFERYISKLLHSKNIWSESVQFTEW